MPAFARLAFPSDTADVDKLVCPQFSLPRLRLHSESTSQGTLSLTSPTSHPDFHIQIIKEARVR